MATKRPARDHATLRTIAELAGVHVSTVSRALNPVEARKVGKDTVVRIRRIAAEQGFEPNPWARSLRTKRTHMIGLVITHLVDGGLATMCEAAAGQAQAAGYQAITFSTQDRPEEQRRLIDVLLERRVDGLILATAHESDPTPDELSDRGTPFVLMNRACGDHPVVRGDDEQGGFLAADHLLDQGHRRIGSVAGPRDVSISRLRAAGFRRAHREHDVEVEEALIVPSSILPEGGLEATKRLLALPVPPTAIVAINDGAALGAMAAVRQHGLRVPDDVAVVGYNDAPTSALLPVELTSVAVPLADIGRRSVDLLLRRLQGEEVESVVVPPVLRVRTSSARPR